MPVTATDTTVRLKATLTRPVPLTVPQLARMSLVPAPTAKSTPALETVATAELEEAQVAFVQSRVEPSANVARALSVAVAPTSNVVGMPLTATAVTVALGDAGEAASLHANWRTRHAKRSVTAAMSCRIGDFILAPLFNWWLPERIAVPALGEPLALREGQHRV